MSNLIVKDNVLIQASHRLSEAEQRLILLAILQARKYGKTIDELNNKELVIHADDYVENFGGSRQASYKALRQAVIGLFNAKWGYKYINKNGNLVVAYERFTQSAKYIENEATVKFMFANAIIPFLCELKNKFTQYEIKQVANLSSSYAMRLYEYFLSFLHKNSNVAYCDVSLDDLRFTLGLLQTEYALMSDFKKRVLDASIKQINDNTDISVIYNQKKQGRNIVGFVFELKRKNTKKSDDTDYDDLFVNLTASEIDIIKEQVQKTIEKNNITSQYHIKNLYKKAVRERWGLDDVVVEQVDDKQVKKNAELRKKQAERQAKLKQQFDDYCKQYDDADDHFKSLVDEKVRNGLIDSKMLGVVKDFDNFVRNDMCYYRFKYIKDVFFSVMSELNND